MEQPFRKYKNFRFKNEALLLKYEKEREDRGN